MDPSVLLLFIVGLVGAVGFVLRMWAHRR